MAALVAVAGGVGRSQLGGASRDERPRQEVGGDHRERDGRGHRPVEELAQARHQGQRGEHQQRAEARHQLGHRHLARAQVGRLLRASAQAQVPVGVLQADDRAVDQRADRQRQAGQRHDVDRVARGVQADEGRQDRDRDRQHGDRRHPPLAQEQQDHQRAEHRAEHPLLDQALDRLADVDRLVHDDLQVDPGAGQPRLHRLERPLERVDHLERAGAELAEDGDVDLALAVDAHDVGLDVSWRPSASPRRAR